MRRTSVHGVWVFSILLILPPSLGAQGFGKSKQTAVLRRKLPAIFHLKGTAVNVKVIATSSNSQAVAKQLGPLLETALQQNDNRITIEGKNPRTVITCNITSYKPPVRQVLSRPNTVVTKRGAQTTPQPYQKVTGAVTVAYNAKDAHSGKALDAATIQGKYDVDFEASGSRTKSVAEAVNPKKLLGAIKGKHEASEAIPGSDEDVIQDLVRQVVGQIASRIVNTDQSMQVMLAKGKLEKAAKFGESGLWPRMLEATEAVPPFPKKADEAYRAYNIGVAYEAMGYAAEDEKQALKLFEKAAIQYGKAIDDKPDEKYFREPQRRIEQALVVLKTLSERHPPATAAPPAAAQTAVAQSEAKSGDALTNDQIIQLAKGGMNEENLIANIKEAKTVSFDLSVAGQMSLMQNGVGNNVISAMRQKTKGPVKRSRPAAPKVAATAQH